MAPVIVHTINTTCQQFYNYCTAMDNEIGNAPLLLHLLH